MKEFLTSQKEKNHTGIPDQMKTHFESKSGFSLDDVKIHYHSDKPDRLHALAYTQGNHVYVGPGQERHLPHELVHVIQQKSGRVAPTKHVGGIAVNDAPSLEREADSMVVRPGTGVKAAAPGPVQRMLLGENMPTDARSLIHEQFTIQDKTPEDVQAMVDSQHAEDTDKYSYTTAGFEFEFLQMNSTEETKHFTSAIHAQFGKSTRSMGFTGLPFYLETDASQAVELVCPPYLVETRKDYVLPLKEDIAAMQRMMTDGLQTVAQNSTNTQGDANIGELGTQLHSVLGLEMEIKLEKDLTRDNYPLGEYDRRAPKTIDEADFERNQTILFYYLFRSSYMPV